MAAAARTDLDRMKIWVADPRPTLNDEEEEWVYNNKELQTEAVRELDAAPVWMTDGEAMVVRCSGQFGRVSDTDKAKLIVVQVVGDRLVKTAEPTQFVSAGESAGDQGAVDEFTTTLYPFAMYCSRLLFRVTRHEACEVLAMNKVLPKKPSERIMVSAIPRIEKDYVNPKTGERLDGGCMADVRRSIRGHIVVWKRKQA